MQARHYGNSEEQLFLSGPDQPLLVSSSNLSRSDEYRTNATDMYQFCDNLLPLGWDAASSPAGDMLREDMPSPNLTANDHQAPAYERQHRTTSHYSNVGGIPVSPSAELMNEFEGFSLGTPVHVNHTQEGMHFPVQPGNGVHGTIVDVRGNIQHSRSTAGSVHGSLMSNVHSGLQNHVHGNGHGNYSDHVAPYHGQQNPVDNSFGRGDERHRQAHGQFLAVNDTHRHGRPRRASEPPKRTHDSFTRMGYPMYGQAPGPYEPVLGPEQLSAERGSSSSFVKDVVATPNIRKASALRRTQEANFVCEIEGCGTTFTTNFKLQSHLKAHMGVKEFVCSIEGCNKAFVRKSDLKRHEMTTQHPRNTSK